MTAFVDELWGVEEDFPSGSVVKNLPAMQETQETSVRSLGQEDPLEEEMQPTPVCLGNAMDRGAWQATVHGVTKDSDRTEHARMHVWALNKLPNLHA